MSSAGGGPSGRPAFFLELRGDIVPYLDLSVFGRLNHNSDGCPVIDVIEADFAHKFCLAVGPINKEFMSLGQPGVAAQADFNEFGPVAAPFAGAQDGPFDDWSRLHQTGHFLRIGIESLNADEFLQEG